MATKRTDKAVKKTPEPEPAAKPITTGISLSKPVFDLLLDVANARKKRRGGRASVSGVISDLVEKHRRELEAELS